MRHLLFLHLLGATVWVGGHLVLLLGVLPRAMRQRDPQPVRQFEQLYERIGIPALLIQIITGFWLASLWLPTGSGSIPHRSLGWCRPSWCCSA